MAKKGGLPKIHYYSHLHPSTESMIIEPPEGYCYTSNVDSSAFSQYKRPPVYQPSRRVLTKMFNTAFRVMMAPRCIPVLKDCDLVHIDGCIVPITTKPWIVGSIEYSGGFFSFDDVWYTRPFSRKLLISAFRSPRCKKILALSEAALESLQIALEPEFQEIKDKTDVLYPAVPSEYPIKAARSSRPDDKIRILFVGTHFFDKGGREVFHAFQRLKSRYDVELRLVTSAPAHHDEYFAVYRKRIESEPGVTIHSDVPKSTLWDEFFLKSHIFCFPTYMDTFGYAILEAMAGNLAVVASDEYAVPEIVRHGETGMLVHVPIASFRRGSLRSPSSVREYRRLVLDEKIFLEVVDSLENTLACLIEDGALRRRLSNAGLREVSEGRFSVKARNKKLGSIYEEALA